MPISQPRYEIRVGIDIGGTFTDFVVFYPDKETLSTFKLPSTPHNPAEAVLAGLERIRTGEPGPLFVIHGSTVATNALLERKGARTALVTTRGFRDVLKIGRQARPALYDLAVEIPPPLIPEELRLEISERVNYRGQVQELLDEQELGHLPEKLQALAAQSVAICLLFSFLHPEHEQRIASRLRAAGFFVSASAEILPEYREYERMSTTAVNAYVSPVMDRYLTNLELATRSPEAGNPKADFGRVRMRVMQSNGGSLSLEEARRNGVRCILSGPAGGLVGARQIARLAFTLEDAADTHALNLLTFDMGGTSTDVSLISGEPHITTETIVGGCPIHVPVLDIHTIGAGGGSIASLDMGGALRVGPESAGADPGPACYARRRPEESLPTVTDANLVLGYLIPEQFLGGALPLDAERAWQAVGRLGEAMSLPTYRTAYGIVEVVNAHMERALRVISVERGHDPREFTLVSFGGAGGLHASSLARRLNIPRLLIPPLASTLSAFGMLASDVILDFSQTVMLDGNTPLEILQAAFQPLVSGGQQALQADGFPPEQTVLEPSVEARYTGQSYELSVPWQGDTGLLRESFHRIHERAYGYQRPGAPLEIVNLRLRARGLITPLDLPAKPLHGPDPGQALISHRLAVLGTDQAGTDTDLSSIDLPFYQGEWLQPGNQIIGPAVVVRADTTILLARGDLARVDAYDNLLITFD